MNTESIGSLPKKEQRGSRARCILLTNGTNEAVAARLSGLGAPFVAVDPEHDYWMPQGFADPHEPKLGEALSLLSSGQREAVTTWWLAVPAGANTPNWDIASTATINGVRGLMLIEAKAHEAEIRSDGKSSESNQKNHARIQAACREASVALNTIEPGWALSTERNYQLCNRFTWAWKLASLGIPVVLVYLGFLRAEEMRDQGLPFADRDQWDHLVRTHSKDIAPATVWDKPLLVNGTPFQAKISSLEVPLPAIS
jgi:hypothetical protein